jgi:hypothetical protein
MMSLMMNHPQFQAELSAARVELRSMLSLK